VRDVSYETARHLLRETRLPIGEIAVALRYADTSAFTRAFGTWSGVTPTQCGCGHHALDAVELQGRCPSAALSA